MFRTDDNFVFQRVTAGLRKPIVRFRLQSGRQVELLGFHLEPGWVFTGDTPKAVLGEVAHRLYPNETPVFITPPEQFKGPAFVCAAYLYSDTPVCPDSSVNYSVLLICGLITNIDKGVRGIVSNLLSGVDWEASAKDDFMW